MRIILIRHAPSMGQKDPSNYSKYGDINVPLDPQHAHLSIECGKNLRTYFNKISLDTPPIFWTSQFMRSQQTFTGIKQGLADHFTQQSLTWHVDPLLNEQSFGILPYIEDIKNPVKKVIVKLLSSMAHQLYKNDSYSSKTLMGESPLDKSRDVRLFMSGSLQNNIDKGHENHVIISHGNHIKPFLMHWFHLYGRDTWQKLDTPGNCDTFVIEGEKGNWSVKKIYDGQNAKSLINNPINPIAHIKKPTDSPPPPLPKMNLDK